MSEERHSFWEQLFKRPSQSDREQKVLQYIAHRLNEGAHLEDVTQEEYVRRNATPDEVREITSSPELVHSARERMQEAFRSGELDPNRPPR